MNNYFNEINHLIENLEVNKRVREFKDNSETLETYWNIGKNLYETGLEKNKYGSNFIKEWGEILSDKYGKSYKYSELMKMKQYYEKFKKFVTLSRISWNHIVAVLPLKDINKRNYYINQVVINNLSIRELRNIIKNNEYERLSYKDKENIELINDNKYALTIEDMIKDPIIINNKNIDKLDEKALHRYIIEMLQNKFLELGSGFNLSGHEYKIKINKRTYKIDLLFFNTELNSYVVVEIKLRELKKEDISQIDFYVNYIDKNIKKEIHNKTVGVLIVKKNNKLVIEYTTNHNIYITTYKLLN